MKLVNHKNVSISNIKIIFFVFIENITFEGNLIFYLDVFFLQIIGLLNAFTPQKSMDEFQDV